MSKTDSLFRSIIQCTRGIPLAEHFTTGVPRRMGWPTAGGGNARCARPHQKTPKAEMHFLHSSSSIKKNTVLRFICILCLCYFATSCANIVPPTGGRKDLAPPKLLAVTPADSQLHLRPSKIELDFNKYITVSDASVQVQISPLLQIPLTVTGLNKHVNVRIPDTLLEEGTTYRITFGTAIRDLHEGNIFPSYSYIFSTGSYFDSLTVKGNVLDAGTGLPDSAALVLLYNAADNDSAIIRHKPLYVTHTDAGGNFTLAGLPPRKFRMYALRDANGNLIFDGGKEFIGFLDAPLTPKADTIQSFTLRDFQEVSTDTSKKNNGIRPAGNGSPPAANKGTGGYLVLADTADSRKRTQDITKPLTILFGKKPGVITPGKVFLTYDSSGISVEAPTATERDSTGMKLLIITDWKQDAVYTLRLQKGFAKDTSGADILPGRFTFHTKRDEDYGTVRIHLPTKYSGRGFVLQVTSATDTIYQKPVLDTNVSLLHLQPGTLTMRVIEDRNYNGKWDAGDVLAKRQPEIVHPYTEPLTFKAGWELDEDFEKQPKITAPPAAKLPATDSTNRRPAVDTGGRQHMLFQNR